MQSLQTEENKETLSKKKTKCNQSTLTQEQQYLTIRNNERTKY